MLRLLGVQRFRKGLYLGVVALVVAAFFVVFVSAGNDRESYYTIEDSDGGFNVWERGICVVKFYDGWGDPVGSAVQDYCSDGETLVEYYPVWTKSLVPKCQPYSVNAQSTYGGFCYEGRVVTDHSRGDMNCDGRVDFSDIDPFVLALSSKAGYEEAYPNCTRMLADVNGDLKINFDDIDPFRDLL